MSWTVQSASGADIIGTNIKKVFGVAVPKSSDAGVKLQAARQGRAPKEFAIVKITFINFDKLSDFEDQLIQKSHEKAAVDDVYFNIKTDKVSWWDYKNVTQAKRYSFQPDIGAGSYLNVILPEPATGAVYLCISGVDWEQGK